MKIYVKGNVYDLPNGELTRQNEVLECKCFARGEIFRGIGGSTYSVDIEVPSTCCNKKLHKHLRKKAEKNKLFKMVLLLGAYQEMEIEGYVIPNQFDMCKYTIEGVGKPKMTPLIDWSNVRDEEG